MLILDTDVCLSILKGSAKSKELFSGNGEEICVTFVTVNELLYAANRSGDSLGNRILAEKFLLTVRIIHPDLNVLKYLADLQASLKKRGKTACLQDMLIYSISRVHGARLVTGQGKRYCFT
jgi:predicted nucleic acid-binding protein